MRVRMKVDVSGTRLGQEWPPRGSVIDLPDDEAAGYCRAGMAEPIAVFDEPETAVQPAPETAVPPEPETRPARRPERRTGPLTKATGPVAS